MPIVAGDIYTGITTTYWENGCIEIIAPEVITVKTKDRKLADKMLKIITAHVKRINKQ